MDQSNGQSNIGVLVRRLETDYISGSTTSSKYVTTSLSDDVNKIYAYLESKHTTGETDSQGREKPFFNVVLAARNIWFRATDIDRKNIRIPATKRKDVLTSFIATAKFQEWAKRENFGKFLNSWGINSAAFNESVLKFVKQDGRLIPSVIPWNRVICDPVKFADNPKIEVLELAEAQLYKNKSYDKDMVDKLCDALRVRETLDKQKKDNKNGYIKLYEVHGEFSQALYKQSKGLEVTDSDEDIYFQQMHVISFVESKKEGEYEDFTLFSGKEDDPYMLAALLPEVDGSIALRGSVKGLFDAQWMQNHTAKSIKDMLDLSSKLIFQTADGNFVGQNALSSIESGDILIHAVNMPLTQINNGSHDIASLQSFGQMWKSVGNEINGISEAMLTGEVKSGTAWRTTEALLGESHSLFEIMTENRGLDIVEMMRRFILPFLKTQMDTSDEIATTLGEYGIDKIDTIYLKNEPIRRTNNKVKETVLSGGTVSPEEQALIQQQEQASLQEGMQTMGNQRFIKPSEVPSKTWKNLFKDFEWTAEVDVTGENIDKDALTTINTILTLMADPAKAQVFNTPRGKFLFNKALELTGTVSPIELNSIPDTPTPTQTQPVAPQTAT